MNNYYELYKLHIVYITQRVNSDKCHGCQRKCIRLIQIDFQVCLHSKALVWLTVKPAYYLRVFIHYKGFLWARKWMCSTNLRAK
ncbi:hypothetical protein CHS0354_016305 [Potamilus streckersoni]|uniref:Uncharacterized protein n=1 Tax=Potamilus streckersoni TaxID=2493646 RepID=A0AAE0RMA1_9BIVA|nr:hypothetical protein CHS0354_016305 [Potamilus streckersoni]